MSTHIYNKKTRSLLDSINRPTPNYTPPPNIPTLSEEKKILEAAGDWITEDTIDRFSITLFRNVKRNKNGKDVGNGINWKLGFQYRLNNDIGKYHRINIPLSGFRRNFVDSLNKKYPDWIEHEDYRAYSNLYKELADTDLLPMVGKGHCVRDRNSYIIPHVLGATIMEFDDPSMIAPNKCSIFIQVHGFSFSVELNEKELVHLMFVEKTYTPDKNILFRFKGETL